MLMSPNEDETGCGYSSLSMALKFMNNLLKPIHTLDYPLKRVTVLNFTDYESMVYTGTQCL